MASPISANRAELLAIANSVATEKMIDPAIVIEAMEEAMAAARIRINCNRRSGRYIRSAQRVVISTLARKLQICRWPLLALQQPVAACSSSTASPTSGPVPFM